MTTRFVIEGPGSPREVRARLREAAKEAEAALLDQISGEGFNDDTDDCPALTNLRAALAAFPEEPE